MLSTQAERSEARVEKAYWSKIVKIFNQKRDLYLVIFPESLEKLRFARCQDLALFDEN